MVNVKLARHGESLAVVVAVPVARSSSAGAVLLDVGTVTLQDSLAGIAAAADGNPVVEKVTVVSRAVALSLDGQLGEVRAGSRGGDRSREVSAADKGRVDRRSEGGVGGEEEGEGSGDGHGCEAIDFDVNECK